MSRIKPTHSPEVWSVEEWGKFESSGDVKRQYRTLNEEEAPDPGRKEQVIYPCLPIPNAFLRGRWRKNRFIGNNRWTRNVTSLTGSILTARSGRRTWSGWFEVDLEAGPWIAAWVHWIINIKNLRESLSWRPRVVPFAAHWNYCCVVGEEATQPMSKSNRQSSWNFLYWGVLLCKLSHAWKNISYIRICWLTCFNF